MGPLLYSFVQVSLAALGHGRALKLLRRGELRAAFEVGTKSLARLKRPRVKQSSPHVLSQIFTITTLLDHVAEKMGQPELARPALREAVDLWTKVKVATPAMKDVEAGAKYVTFFENRLGSQGKTG